MRHPADDLTATEEKILTTLHSKKTNIDICGETNFSKQEVAKALKHLRERGLIVSVGSTAARKHIRLEAAVQELYQSFLASKGEI